MVTDKTWQLRYHLLIEEMMREIEELRKVSTVLGPRSSIYYLAISNQLKASLERARKKIEETNYEMVPD